VQPLCVIPARAGSKRLAFKNGLQLAGRPMLDYSVIAAIESGIFDRVYVSTEDDAIAGMAAAAGATVHRRPAALAGDLVSATEVCLETATVREKAGDRVDAVVCLQPSSPLRTADDIRSAWQHFVNSEADFLVSVTPLDPHYFHWAVHQAPEGWRMYFGDQFLIERPLLPPMFRPNGAIKIGRIGPLRGTANFFGAPLEVYVMPETRSLHVAEQWDFDLADNVLRRAARAGTGTMR